MTVLNFWSSIDIGLLSEILGLGIIAWALGYKAGYLVFVTRMFAHKST